MLLKTINLFTISFAEGYNVVFLGLLSIVAIMLGFYILTTKSPIVCVLSLIGLFVVISVYLLSTGVTFIALAYLLVYVGAVSILFLFIVMLINVRISELAIESLNGIPLGIVIGLLIYYFVRDVLPTTFSTLEWLLSLNIGEINFVTSINWDKYMEEFDHILGLGIVLYGEYSMWLIITSIILLLAMVGSIVITIKSRGKPVILSSLLIGIDRGTLVNSHNLFDIQLFEDVINAILVVSLIVLFYITILALINIVEWLAYQRNNYCLLYFRLLPSINYIGYYPLIYYIVSLFIIFCTSLELDSIICLLSTNGSDGVPSESDPSVPSDSGPSDSDPSNSGPSGSDPSNSGPSGSDPSNSDPSGSSGAVSSASCGNTDNPNPDDPARLQRIGNCLHTNRETFTPQANTTCDFDVTDGQAHNARQNAPWAHRCLNCGAILCSNCAFPNY
jgi:NADH-ubiquinone oxidoreductase chain 6